MQAKAHNVQIVQFENTENQSRSKILQERAQKFTMNGKLNGHKAKICRDTQCHLSIVNSKFVSDKMMTTESAMIRGIGGVIQVPLAHVHIESEQITGVFKVAVVEKLEHDMLLGIDIDNWEDYQVEWLVKLAVKPVMVVTRAQKKQHVEECNSHQLELQKRVETETQAKQINKEKSVKTNTEINQGKTKQNPQKDEQKTLLERVAFRI